MFSVRAYLSLCGYARRHASFAYRATGFDFGRSFEFSWQRAARIPGFCILGVALTIAWIVLASLGVPPR